MNNSTRVILNTFYLYLNMLVTLAVQLVSVRILLSAMGLVDYGIFNLVAGIVALFAFMNVAMAAATQRFLSYTLGNRGTNSLKEVFYQSVVLHLFLGVIIIILLETCGIYYISNILEAPSNRLLAAQILLHCITASTFVNIITVPYEACINAHENMGIIALLNICDSLMKLGAALIVLYSSGDRLVIYGLLTMTSLMLTLFLKRLYCQRHYKETHFHFHKIHNYAQMKSLTSFAVWNLIGSGCSVARYQGTAMILNFFFGILINAAYGIAQQVNGLLNFFANTITRAMRPQIIKSEGEGNRERMLRLSSTTCKVTALMLAFLAIPFSINLPFIMQIWLSKSPSPDCIMFCRCFLLIVLINQLTIGLQIAIEAAGKIRTLQTTVGFLHLVALPLGYLCFKSGMPPVSLMICIIGEEIIAIFLRTYIAKRLLNVDAYAFLTHTVLPVVSACVLVWGLCQCTMMLTSAEWLICIISTTLSTFLLGSLSYFIVFNASERRVFNGLFHMIIPFVTRAKK